MSTEQPRTAVSVRVNPEVDAMIAYGAHFLGLTKKGLVARALRDYLAARLEALVAQPSGQSYADLIAEWQAEHGAFTEDEMAAARAELIAADEEACAAGNGSTRCQSYAGSPGNHVAMVG